MFNLFHRWKNYNPDWLVKAAQPYYEEHPWLKDALIKCNKAKIRSKYYTCFVNAKHPNQPGSEWQIQENIIIEESIEGEIILDIIKTNRVGGIEFLGKLY